MARLVWSGASEDDEAIRDTRVVLGDLFGRAERHVLISTLVVYNGRAVFAPLAARLRSRPDIRVDLFVNLNSKTGRDEDEAAEVASFLDEFAREHFRGVARSLVLTTVHTSRHVTVARASATVTPADHGRVSGWRRRS